MGDSRRHPFTYDTMEAQVPLTWKGLNVDRYDGITDPDKHVDVYTTQISLYTSHDSLLCRVFPTSLKGELSVSSQDFPQVP